MQESVRNAFIRADLVAIASGNVDQAVAILVKRAAFGYPSMEKRAWGWEDAQNALRQAGDWVGNKATQARDWVGQGIANPAVDRTLSSVKDYWNQNPWLQYGAYGAGLGGLLGLGSSLFSKKKNKNYLSNLLTGALLGGGLGAGAGYFANRETKSPNVETAEGLQTAANNAQEQRNAVVTKSREGVTPNQAALDQLTSPEGSAQAAVRTFVNPASLTAAGGSLAVTGLADKAVTDAFRRRGIANLINRNQTEPEAKSILEQFAPGMTNPNVQPRHVASWEKVPGTRQGSSFNPRNWLRPGQGIPQTQVTGPTLGLQPGVVGTTSGMSYNALRSNIKQLEIGAAKGAPSTFSRFARFGGGYGPDTGLLNRGVVHGLSALGSMWLANRAQPAPGMLNLYQHHADQAAGAQQLLQQHLHGLSPDELAQFNGPPK